MSWGAIGAAGVAVVGGAMLNKDKGGNKTTQAQQTVANPFTAGGGLFNTTFGPGVSPAQSARLQQAISALTPEQQARYAELTALSNTMIGTPGASSPEADAMRLRIRTLGSNQGEGPGNVDVERAVLQALEQPTRRGILPEDLEGLDPAIIEVLNAHETLATASNDPRLGLNMEIVDPRLQALSEQGLAQAGLFFDQAINNETADLAGARALDFLNQLEADPMQVAERQFNLLNPILQRQQEEDFLAQEQRLYSQGRLGGSGALSGQAQQRALFDAQMDAERKLLFDSLGQGMAVQAQNATLGATLAQLDPGLRGLFQGLGQGALQTPMAIQQAMLNQAQVAGGLSGANTVGSLTQPGLNPQNAVGAGLLNTGIQGLTNAIPGLFQGGTRTGTYTGGPRPMFDPSTQLSGPYPGTTGR